MISPAGTTTADGAVCSGYLHLLLKNNFLGAECCEFRGKLVIFATIS